MVLNLQKIYQPENKTYNIIVRNHRDNVMAFCCPHNAEYINFGRWLGRWGKCTELNITNVYGRTASIQIEDSDWQLIVSGNIQGGRKVVDVGGSRDFDIRFTANGHMVLECLGGYNWGAGIGKSLDFIVVPFLQ
ncbi:uncharacterized protein GGS22DRAFT_167575 [Annulohypoxylon maeteangense]|uniref:uncharacterized protein n=1 Tax=Annulohypoxylon maeteangense TaxID=1927788 RepID=UPI002008AE7F|nr:uncharacterized protein GGS22DRAFT_167575 [Annulohypoxylon maeteangense]KAI0883628.1 hypothetical protein GGS22DRAFT_167575 [Annulohypoxylon maeteangense]